MTVAELIGFRRGMGYSQTEMAESMGMGLRAYQAIEAGDGTVSRRHRLLVERCALSAAVQADPVDIMLMPVRIREEVLRLHQALQR